jgi:F0F1-type ATP synthase membrane subunit b/b'
MTTTPNDPYGSSGYGEGESTSAVPDYSAGGTDYADETTGYAAGTSGYASEGDYSTQSGDSSSSTTDAAKQQAQNVKDTTAQATQQVADTAKQQATQVAGDAKQQAQQLASQAKQEVSSQVTSQRDRAADTLRSLSQEFRGMAESSSESGLGATLASQGADLAQQAADFLSEREPSQLLDEVRTFARKRPGGFLVGAALAGAVVGRLSRGAMSARSNDDSSYDSAQSGQFDSVRASIAPSADYDIYSSQPTSAAPATPSGWSPAAAQPAPILNEPYGEQQPPAGYDPGYGGRP